MIQLCAAILVAEREQRFHLRARIGRRLQVALVGILCAGELAAGFAHPPDRRGNRAAHWSCHPSIGPKDTFPRGRNSSRCSIQSQASAGFRRGFSLPVRPREICPLRSLGQRGFFW